MVHVGLDSPAATHRSDDARAESHSPVPQHIADVTLYGGDTHDTRYDVWGFGGRSCCQGAVQEMEVVPSEGSRAFAKLDPGWKARYRTIGGSTLVPVQLPARRDGLSYGSSLGGKSEIG